MSRLAATFQTLKIQTRLVVYYITFALITLGAVVFISYRQAVNSLHATIEDKLQVIAELKMNNLGRWVDERQSNVIFLASLPELRSLSGQLLDSSVSEVKRIATRRELTELLTIIVQRTSDFQDIQIIDLNGNIVVSIIPSVVGLSQADQPYFREGKSRTFAQPFYESELLRGITFTVSTPL